MPQDTCCCGTSVWSDGIILRKFYCLGIKTCLLEVKSRQYLHKFLGLRFDDTKLSYLLVFYSCGTVGISYSSGSWVSSWSRSISVSDSKSSSPGDPNCEFGCWRMKGELATQVFVWSIPSAVLPPSISALAAFKETNFIINYVLQYCLHNLVWSHYHGQDVNKYIGLLSLFYQSMRGVELCFLLPRLKSFVVSICHTTYYKKFGRIFCLQSQGAPEGILLKPGNGIMWKKKSSTRAGTQIFTFSSIV